MALLLVALVGAGIECVIIAIALTYWAQYARLIRGQILMLKNEIYVEATRSLGATDFTILFKHLFPNAVAPVIVAATIGIGKSRLRHLKRRMQMVFQDPHSSLDPRNSIYRSLDEVLKFKKFPCPSPKLMTISRNSWAWSA